MINENLQILHLPTLLSSLLWLSSSPLLPLGFFHFPALILLLVVPHQIWYQSTAFNCSYN